MMRKLLLLIVVALFSVYNANAQSSCEKLYATAVKYQQTMTVASQNQAITYFKKAKVCFDSETKKSLCDNQIKTCTNTIALIKKKAQSGGTDSSSSKSDKSTNASAQKLSVADTVAVEIIQVELSVSENVVKFKAKGGEFKKVKVTCNYSDWKVTEHPDWIDISTNTDNELVLEASKNPDKEERSGMVTIVCRDASVSFAVMQSKKSLLNSIGI